MQSTKIETTVLSHPAEPLTPLQVKILVERLGVEARRFMQERGYFGPGCVITMQVEIPEMERSAA